MFWLILIIIVCIIFEGFFSGSEIAIVSADKAMLQHRANEGSSSARTLLYMLEKPELIIGTTLLGTNFSLVIANFAANELFARYISSTVSGVSLIFTIPLTLFFGEILPKSYFRKYSNTIAYKVIKPLRFFTTLFYPVVITLSKISGLIRSLILTKKFERTPYITRDEFMMLLEQQHAPKDDFILRLIGNLASYMEKTVGDIAIPMVNVSHCKPEDDYRTVIEVFVASRYSRLPVYDDRKDEIIGVINDMQLLDKKNRNKKASAIAQKTICIPENLELSRGLIAMRKDYKEMAAVIDEYGGTVGIISLKDIVAEITGKLADRYETDEQSYMHNISEDTFIVDAQFRLEELEEKAGVHFQDLPFETVGGLLNHLLGRIPQKDDSCLHDNLTFTVLRARPQKAEMVRISIKRNEEK